MEGKKLIAVRKVFFKDFTNFKLEHLKYRGKRHKFYKITNSNIIYEFENNGKELIMILLNWQKNTIYMNIFMINILKSGIVNCRSLA